MTKGNKRPIGKAQPALSRTSADVRASTRGAKAVKIEKQGHGVAILVTVLALICFVTPSFIILSCGMAPSWVSYLADKRRHPYRLSVITACNLAGVLPYLGMLWSGNGTITHAMDILSDIYVWATMYLGAALGLLVYRMGPPVAAIVLNIRMDRERQSLDAIRRAMVEEWGTDVLPPPEKRAVGAETSKDVQSAKKNGT